jgi:hypothetical protein
MWVMTSAPVSSYYVFSVAAYPYGQVAMTNLRRRAFMGTGGIGLGLSHLGSAAGTMPESGDVHAAIAVIDAVDDAV